MKDFSDPQRRNQSLNAVLNFVQYAAPVQLVHKDAKPALNDVEVGVKANIMVQGQPFHAGIGSLENRLATNDAEVVRKLREAGAIITFILNMEEGALGAKSDNPHFGAVQNPHLIGYTPGGSSGGSGAAVAAGLCDIALGTDTMGSVRIPAAHCGVYGFKPATDRVSQHGLEPADLSLDAIGPLARDLDLLEQVARIMSDFGEADMSGDGAVLSGHGVEVDPAVATVFAAALAALPRKPAQVTLDHPNSRIRFAGFIGVSRAMAAHLQGVETTAHLAKLLSYGPRRSDTDMAEDRAILAATRRSIRDVVERHGFLIMPTVPNPPFPHSEAEPAAQADFTCLANIAGLPAISIPAGWTNDNLPIGVQLVGAAGAEAGLFALARHLDTRLNAYLPPNPSPNPSPRP